MITFFNEIPWQIIPTPYLKQKHDEYITYRIFPLRYFYHNTILPREQLHQLIFKIKEELLERGD